MSSQHVLPSAKVYVAALVFLMTAQAFSMQETSPANGVTTRMSLQDSPLRSASGSSSRNSSRRYPVGNQFHKSSTQWGKSKSAMNKVQQVSYQEPIGQTPSLDIPFQPIGQKYVPQPNGHNSGTRQSTARAYPDKIRRSISSAPTGSAEPSAGIQFEMGAIANHPQSSESSFSHRETFENRHDEALATDNPRGGPDRYSNSLGQGLQGHYTAPDRQLSATEKLIMRDAEIRLLRSELAKLKTENQTLRSELQLTVDVLNRTHTALSESESQIISLTNENNGLKDGFRTLTIEFQKSETEVERLLKQLRTMVSRELSEQKSWIDKNTTHPDGFPGNEIIPKLNEGPVPGTELLPSPK